MFRVVVSLLVNGKAASSIETALVLSRIQSENFSG